MKKKVTLVMPGKYAPPTVIHKTATLRLPLGLLFLARPLQKSGYEVKIVDTRLGDFSVEDVRDSVCVGIGAYTGPQITYGLQVAAKVRAAFPETPIVWGSIHPTIFPEQTLENPLVDLVISGEGETAFTALVEALRGGGMKDDVLKDVPSLTWRNVVGEVFNNPRAPLSNMDDVDLPAYDLVDIERYYNIRNSFDYQSSRGCPFKCSFCYNEMFNDSKWRCKSGEKVVEEMTYLHRKYGVRNFATVDDEFFIKRSRTRIIVDGLIKNGGGFKWSGFCRFDTFAGFDDELVRDLPKAGVEQMFFGAESGNAKTLELIKKKITVDQVISAMERTQKYNIHPVVSFIVGFPHEEEESIEATLALCDRIKSINPNAEIGGLLSYTPYPGAGLFNTAVDNGFEAPKSLEEWGLWRFNDRMEHPWLSPAMRQKLRTISIISRFRFFSEEFFRRTRGRGILRMAFWVANSPFRLSSAVRWKYRCWRYPFEWNLWAWLVRRAFGFF